MKALQPEILMNKRGKFIPFIFIEWGTLYTRQEAVCPEYNDWVQLFVKGGYHPANAGMSYAVFNSSTSIYLLVFWQYYLCVLYPFQEISGKKLMWKLLRETIGRIWFGFMHLSNCDILVTATHSFILIYSLLKEQQCVLHLYTYFRYFINRKMQSVIFKSSIIYSFITVMIVIFFLTVICDLKYINDKKTEVNESMTYEDQLNMFLSNSK